MRTRSKAFVASLFICAAANAPANIDFGVTFNDPSHLYTAYNDAITASMLAAGAQWAQYLTGDAAIDVQVNFDPGIPTANAASATSVPVAAGIFEQGAAAKARTGHDANGLLPDALLTIGTGYLTHELFFGAGPVPLDRTDATSVFMHELGHIFGFNGWRNGQDASLPGFESTFDALTLFDGTRFWFDGPQADEVYGGPIPLTTGNIFHVDSATDLMSGTTFLRGQHYDISPLDVAMLCDVGVACRHRIPEPPVWLVFAIGALALKVARRGK